MRLLIQRVSRAKVTVAGEVTGSIEKGLLIFVGVGSEDTAQTCFEMVSKASKLRIFESESGKMDKDVNDAGGSVLIVSQFTLYGDVRKGNRPSFTGAARPETAMVLYDTFVAECRKVFGAERVAEGRFAAMMDVELCNNGPVTIWVESGLH